MVANQVCEACNRRTNLPWVCYDIHMNLHIVCAECVQDVARSCPCCEMTLTHECFEDNENVCIICLDEDDDEDYVPNSDEEGDDTDTDSTGSDTSTDDGSDASSDTSTDDGF